jgi:hypothetical protein
LSWLSDGLRVQPAYEQFKGILVFVRQAIALLAARLLGRVFVLGVECPREERRVVAEEALVQGPVLRLGSNIDVDNG